MGNDLEQFESNIVAPWNNKFENLKVLTKFEELEAIKIQDQQNKVPSQQPSPVKQREVINEVEPQITAAAGVAATENTIPSTNQNSSDASKISTPPEIIDYSTSTQDFTSSTQPTNSNSQQLNENYSNQNTMPLNANQQISVLSKNQSTASSGNKREAPKAPNSAIQPDEKGDRNISSQSSDGMSQHGSEITRKIERDNRGKKSGNSDSSDD